MTSSSLSPAVSFDETDLTGGLPAVATSIGAFAGDFIWGPVEDVTTLSNETDLVSRFGKPTLRTYSSFFSASNFLAYSTNLLCVRSTSTGQLNSVATGSPILIKNQAEYDVDFSNGQASVGMFAAKYPGEMGNSIKVSMSDSSSFSKTLTGSLSLTDGSTTVAGVGTDFVEELTVGSIIELTVGGIKQQRSVSTIVDVDSLTIDSPFNVQITSSLSGTVAVASNSNVVTGVGTTFTTDLVVGNKIKLLVSGNYVYKTISTITSDTSIVVDSVYLVSGTGLTGTKIVVTATGIAANAYWEFYKEFALPPQDSRQAISVGATNDGLHIVVVDVLGKFGGTPNTILERIENAHKAVNALSDDGSSGYYLNVLRNSVYVWWMDHPETEVLSSTGLDFGTSTVSGAYKTLLRPLSFILTGGSDGAIPTPGETQQAFDIFVDNQKYDLSLLFTGKVNTDTARYVIQNIAEVRRDCVAFISPVNPFDNSVIVGNSSESIETLIAYRNALNLSSSYGFIDSGFKYQYDKYNDVYRYVPLNADIAGLCARTDYVANYWNSPAGFNRGQIKNVTKLAVNPNKTQRDSLFAVGINSVVSFPAEGTVLFGDKTSLARSSAFDEIGIRRLFNTLEKKISAAAKYFLFEQNTEADRQLFVNIVNPEFRAVQGAGGIAEFLVDVGPLVNTPDVIDAKTFAAKFYIKPTHTTRFIELHFIATRTSQSFSELG